MITRISILRFLGGCLGLFGVFRALRFFRALGFFRALKFFRALRFLGLLLRLRFVRFLGFLRVLRVFSILRVFWSLNIVLKGHKDGVRRPVRVLPYALLKELVEQSDARMYCDFEGLQAVQDFCYLGVLTTGIIVHAVIQPTWRELASRSRDYRKAQMWPIFILFLYVCGMVPYLFDHTNTTLA